MSYPQPRHRRREQPAKQRGCIMQTLATIGTFTAAGCIVSFVFGANFLMDSPILQGLIVGEVLLDEDDTYECDGSDTITLEDKTIEVSGGTGVIARDRCELKLVNCEIRGDTALRVEDSAKVTIVEGSLSGDVSAVDARDQGKVRLVNTSIDGTVRRSGKARVERP